MKIQFFGGAQTVTGSQHLISINGKKILLECGMYQGRRKEAYERNSTLPFDVSKIDMVLLSLTPISIIVVISPAWLRTGMAAPFSQPTPQSTFAK
jgi:predicted metal-dependent RNase